MLYLYNIRVFVSIVLLVLFSTSCKKENDFASEEDNIILAYWQQLGVDNYIKDESNGIYYLITEYTNNIKPISNSEIEVKYKGYLLDGTVFSPDSTALLKLSETIIGWQLILTKFTIGTKGTIIIPSRFAYGKKGLEGYVPPYSIVAFDIELINIHPFF